ncbi:hypothetical protein YT1_5063 [Rhodococcus ruber]|nr:hypothetical protein YT1_5063 [Rhodococcus ruber]
MLGGSRLEGGRVRNGHEGGPFGGEGRGPRCSRWVVRAESISLH